MKYRIKEIKNTTNDGTEFSKWYVQIKYKYIPFWFTLQEFSISGCSWDYDFASKEAAENYINKSVNKSEKIYHDSTNN